MNHTGFFPQATVVRFSGYVPTRVRTRSAEFQIRLTLYGLPNSFHYDLLRVYDRIIEIRILLVLIDRLPDDHAAYLLRYVELEEAPRGRGGSG